MSILSDDGRPRIWDSLIIVAIAGVFTLLITRGVWTYIDLSATDLRDAGLVQDVAVFLLLGVGFLLARLYFRSTRILFRNLYAFVRGGMAVFDGLACVGFAFLSIGWRSPIAPLCGFCVALAAVHHAMIRLSDYWPYLAICMTVLLPLISSLVVVLMLLLN